MNPKPSFGPIIGSGIVVLVLIFGAVSLVISVFRERAHQTVLPPITEYERIATTTESSTTSPKKP